MRIAVLYTGEIRTIHKTMKWFIKNVLKPNNTNTVHVFATLQCDLHEYGDWIQDSLGDHLQSLLLFNKDGNVWNKIKENTSSVLKLSNGATNYITTRSGSMIEHYQTYLSYLEMTKKENEFGVPYDYIIRTRPDVLIAKPIDFHWLEWTEEDVKKRIGSDVTESSLKFLLCSMLYESRAFVQDSISNNQINNLDFYNCKTPNDVVNYIRNGRYIITMRENQSIIARRSCFYTIPSIGVMYGTFKTDSEYWYDSESQLRGVCKHSGISMFDYTTQLEASSIFQYNPDNFFDIYGNLREDINVLFFLVRT